MAAKRIKKTVEPTAPDEILISMLERYFRLYGKEDIGKTREITLTLDRLEKEIKGRKS